MSDGRGAVLAAQRPGRPRSAVPACEPVWSAETSLGSLLGRGGRSL